MELPIALLHPDAALPTRAHPGDAGLDLRSVERASIDPGGRVSIGTGLAVAIPAGHAGLVVPRSGLAAEHGIALVNAPGVIDAGYRGEIRVLLLNTDGRNAFTVEPGERVAQLLLTPVLAAEPRPVATLDETPRGDGGFGSSGR